MNRGEATRVNVSVVIPVRNGGRYLLRAVKSTERVALISGLEIEVVIVDDGADVPVRDNLGSAHLRIATSVIEGPRSGPSAARNVGAAHARGDHLAFLDVDDVILPGWVEFARSIVTESASEPHVVAVRGSGVLEDLTGGSRRIVGPSWLPACYIVRRSAFEEVGGFDVRIAYGEHHHLGERVEVLESGCVVDRGSIGPVMVKLDDRTVERRIGYAASRHGAAIVQLESLTDARERATLFDVASVSLARLEDWRGARSAARDALQSAPRTGRRLRYWVLGIPGARGAWYRGRLAVGDRFRRWRRFLYGCATTVERAFSLGLALSRSPAPVEVPDPTRGTPAER
jgi:hypothetical protein